MGATAAAAAYFGGCVIHSRASQVAQAVRMAGRRRGLECLNHRTARSRLLFSLGSLNRLFDRVAKSAFAVKMEACYSLMQGSAGGFRQSPSWLSSPAYQ